MRYYLRLIISLIGVLFSMFANGQINSSIDFITGWEYTYRTLEVSKTADSLMFIVDVRNNIEKSKSNFRIGFNYNQRVSSNIHLKTGLRLAAAGYIENEKDYLYWPNQNMNGEFDPDSLVSHSLKFSREYWFIEIPLAARVQLNKKKLSPFIEAGISPHFYMTTKVIQVFDEERTVDYYDEPDDKFNTFSMAANISGGVNYDLSEKYQLFGQGIFRYHFTKTFAAPVIEHLYNAGVEVGIRKIFMSVVSL